MSNPEHIITGKLRFSPRKVLLESENDTYFIRPFSIRPGYVHGDHVRARITRPKSGDKLAEVELIILLERSNEVLLASVFYKKGKQYLGVKKEQGILQTPLFAGGKKYVTGDILAIKFARDGTIRILEKFAHDGDYDLDERLIFFLGHVRTEFPAGVLEEGESLMKPKMESLGAVLSFRRKEKSLSPLLMRNNGDTFSNEDFERDLPQGYHSLRSKTYGMIKKENTHSFEDIEEKFLLPLVLETTKFNKEILLFHPSGNRIDFRNWYTLTIDGADAKDLDDAISVARYQDGGFLLAVHIADVAEYVHENSELDKEALLRATSIYTPGRVIPMLPEVLSNDLCSLHPGSPKDTLSCLMKLDKHGHVERAEIVEGIMESQKKGVYDSIMNYRLGMVSPPVKGGSPTVSVEDRGVLSEITKDSFSEIQEQTPLSPPLTGGFRNQFHTTISLAFELYEILKKRRQKEGKIMFESTEMSFQFGVPGGEPKKEKENIPTNIVKRERNDAHMMIEEFMVLANEEVAKWCVRHELPFLSRVHGLPARENIGLIATIIDNLEAKKKLEPHHIREYMERIADPVEQFRLSRLLLPKMAKATYTDSPFRHFGLALSFYSHFTSPIRRYPDLQVHRIIKEEIHGKMSTERKAHYRNLLKKVARLASERERAAEDIERAFDALYMCRYMQDKVGKTYDGRISGITEYALYVELPNGVEGTIFLPRKKFGVNPVTGSLESVNGKELYHIGQELQVVIDEVRMEEKRIVVVEGKHRI